MFAAIRQKRLNVNVGCPAIRKFVMDSMDSPGYSWIPFDKPDKGHTLLHVAACHSSLEVVRKLLELGADPTLRNAHDMLAVDVVGPASEERPVKETEAIRALLVSVFPPPARTLSPAV